MFMNECSLKSVIVGFDDRILSVEITSLVHEQQILFLDQAVSDLEESDDEIIANVTLLVQGRANHNFYCVPKVTLLFLKCAL